MGNAPDPPKDQTRQNLESAEFVPPWQNFSDEQLRNMTTERGLGYVDPPPHPVPKEPTCPEDPPCTDLLADPASVLSDKERWPEHLCYGLFLRRSTTQWASSIPVALTTTALEEYRRWCMEWPLPIGLQSIGLRFAPSKGEILNLAPFKKREEALWAIRVSSAGSAADLFGLGIRYGNGEETTYSLGALKYVLEGAVRSCSVSSSMQNDGGTSFAARGRWGAPPTPVLGNPK